MITRDLTEYKCDSCCTTKTEYAANRYDEKLPQGWISPHHNTIGEEISFMVNDERIDVIFKGVCFCSVKCLADYFLKKLMVSTTEEALKTIIREQKETVASEEVKEDAA